jgi:hypothetical protein
MQPVSCAGCQALQQRQRDLQAENEPLRRQLDEATRAGKRQAAPFAKGTHRVAALFLEGGLRCFHTYNYW